MGSLNLFDCRSPSHLTPTGGSLSFWYMPVSPSLGIEVEESGFGWPEESGLGWPKESGLDRPGQSVSEVSLPTQFRPDRDTGRKFVELKVTLVIGMAPMGG